MFRGFSRTLFNGKGGKRSCVVELATLRNAFDTDYYQSTYSDIADAGDIDPVEHYYQMGWKEGRDPSPNFSTSYYLDRNPDVRVAGVNPFLHYLNHGQHEGRLSMPDESLCDDSVETRDETIDQLAIIRDAFDNDFYLSTYEDIAEVDGLDVAEHYFLTGWKEGRDPSPNFSTSYYLENNSDVRDAGVNPFLHYLNQGCNEGRLPALSENRSDHIQETRDDSLEETSQESQKESLDEYPDDSSDETTDELAILRDAFDSDFYLSTYKDIAEVSDLDTAEHYFLTGWKEGRDPSPFFSTNHYLDANPDVKDAGMNPYLHYLVAGKDEGRQTAPAFETPEKSQYDDLDIEEAIDVIRDAFDVEFYRSTYADMAQCEDDFDFAEHYFITGWKEGRDPSLEFSTSYYLDSYPDVSDAGINPFFHFLRHGKFEGRECRPEVEVDQQLEPQDSQFAEELAIIRDAFDTDFYRSQYADMAEKGSFDCAEHYYSVGWKEERDPSPIFSTSHYLRTNGDVRETGINPFLHYLITGKQEGRTPMHPGGSIAANLAKVLPLEDMVIQWRTVSGPEKLVSDFELRNKVEDAIASGFNDLVISISHDNFVESAGGVQYCIQREEKIATNRGALHLHLSPYSHIPRLSHDDEASNVKVVIHLNGEEIGVATMRSVTHSVRSLAGHFSDVDVVIHHLMGHSLKQINQLIHATGSNKCWIWLHDFFSLCPSYALQRNNVSFCGAPSPESNACTLCLFGKERISHKENFQAFFEDLTVHLVAPSEFAAQFWEERSPYSFASLSVCDHVRIDSEKREREKDAGVGPITIAFAGYPVPYKGWSVFENLVRSNGLRKTPLRFVYLGISDVSLQGVESIPVQVTSEKPNAMIDAMEDNNVDFLLHWASCAETFSFSAHEALAAGAYVLTHPESGNVAALVNRLGQGTVVDSPSDLDACIDDGRLEALAKEARAKRSEYKNRFFFSDGIFSVLDKQRIKD